MSATEELRTQVDKGRHAISDLAWNVIEKVPDVVDATLEEIHRDGPLALGQAHEFVEHVVAGAQDRMAVHNPTDSRKWRNLVDQGEVIVAKLPSVDDVHRSVDAGVQQAKSGAAHARRRAERSAKRRSGGHGWKRAATFLIVGLAAGVLMNRILRAQRRPDNGAFWPTDRTGTSVRTTSAESQGEAPYYTSATDPANEGGVYHDHEGCPAGQRIKPEHRVSGTDGRSLCKDCQSMAS
jgi:hypothetical protein